MILERITFLLEQLYKHSAFNSNCIEAVSDNVDRIAKVIGEPDGSVTFGGVAELNPDTARKAFAGEHGTIEAKAVRMGFQFKQHVYLSANSNLNKEIEDALDEAPLQHLRDAFANYEKLNCLVDLSKKNAEEIEQFAVKAKSTLNSKIQGLVESATQAELKRLAEEYEKAAETTKQINAALKRISEAEKKYESLKAEASNIVAASKPATRSIASIKS